MSDSDSDDGLFRGQCVPPLVKYFQRVLRRYPDGGQILKELLQNADDAGATEVKFLLDTRNHGGFGLLHEGLARFQGPALYAYNNATFSKDDWSNLMNVDQSKKEGELLKVGRFGLGFISVYHMTDFPTIVSGNTVAFLEPHAQYLPRRATGTSRSVQRVLERYRGHAATFQGVLGCQLKTTGTFNGTLFRFPLRQSESQLSSTVYNADDVRRKLFNSFKEESEKALLFLKHVQAVELFERSSASHQEVLILKVMVSPRLQRAVYTDRQQLATKAQLGFRKAQLFPQTSALSTTVWSPADGQVEQHFCVVNCVDTRHRELNELGHRLNLLPWVGVACPLPKQLGGAEKMSMDSQWQEHPLLSTGGNAFCFLPLPNLIITGCPVHLNGYFAIADNRRSIKWPSHDDTGEEARWNKLLVEMVLSKAYAVLLKSIAEALDPQTNQKYINAASSCYSLAYAAWPDMDRLNTMAVWQSLVKPLAASIGTDTPMFWTAAGGGQRVSLVTALFLHSWHDSHGEERRINHSVAKVMLDAKKPIVILPQRVVRWLQKVSALSPVYKRRLVSPAVVRAALRDLLKTSSGKNLIQGVDTAHHLLDFILRDEDYQDLVGLPLLPMVNGNFAALAGRFSARGTTIFLPVESSRAELFPNIGHLFVDIDGCKETPGLTDKLKKLAKSNATELVILTLNHIPELLLQSIKTWAGLRSGQVVAWRPGKNNNPSRAWLEKLWHWLNTTAEKLSLSKLSMCAIVPSSWKSSTVYLHKPSLSSACIAPSQDGHLTELADYFRQIGCYLMDDAPCCQHQGFGQIVHSPTASGVVGAFSAAMNSHGQQEFIRIMSHYDPHGVHRRRLCHFLNNACILRSTPFTSDQQAFLRCLPLFDTIQAGQLVAVRDGYHLPPASALPAHVSSIPSKLLDPDKCQDSIQLLHELGLRCLDEESFILQHIVPHLKSCSSRDKVTYAMHIITRSQNLPKQQLSQSKFIPSCHSGRLAAPVELYDPTDNNFRQLFLSAEDAFPCNEISQHRVCILHLQQLGLQTTASLTAVQKENLVIERAKKMASFSVSFGLENTIERAKILLCLLESLLGKRQVSTLLKTIPWLPAEAQAPSSYPHGLKWYGEDVKGHLMAPADLRVDTRQRKFLRDDFLVGASCAVISNQLRGTCQESPAVCAYFGWDSLCRKKEVIEQLKLLVQTTAFRHPCGEVSDEYQQSLEYSIMTLYNYLQRYWKNPPQLALPKKWVWVRETMFVEPERVVLQMPSALRNVSLEPYRYVLGERLKKAFPQLFETYAGIKPLCGDGESDHQLLQILQDIAAANAMLAEDEVDVYCRILKLLGKPEMSMPVPVPRYDRALCPPGSCSYPDQDSMHWLSQSFSAEELSSYSIVHHMLDPNVAQQLGVRPLSSQLIAGQSLGFTGFSPLGERYGPKETLTHRLKGILEDYSGDSTILKELVQNADDAKASKVCIMVDWRSCESTTDYGVGRFLHPNMSTWQGPAIWAYNDAEFSDADFKNIVWLAGATKEAQAGKIGRFGLGFNAVYHLTDVPSFVSRRFVSFFDPHAKYMPNHVCASDPGVKIDFVQKQSVLRRSFPDQFSKYEGVFGCSILNCNSEHGFSGTLFRFPLRSGVHSDICNEEYTPPRVQQLLTSFQKEMKNILIFLQFVRKISVFELSESAHSPSEAVLVSSCELSVSSEMSTFSLENVSPTSLLCRLTTDKDQIEGHLQQWLSHQEGSSSSLCSSVPPFVMYQAVVKLQEWGKLSGPTSQSLSLDRNHHDCTQLFTWLVCSGGGGQQAADLAVQSRGRLFPWAGVAIPVTVADNGMKTVESLSHKVSRVYCFLPLPISAGFGFHVNGFFAVDKTRRHLCYDSTNQDDLGTMWNIAIAKSTLPRLVCELIKPVRPIVPQKTSLVDSQEHLKKYFEVWPTAGSGLWHDFITAFYEFLASDENFPLLWAPTNGGEWKSAEECIILDAHQELPGELFLVAVDVLASLGHSVALAPCDVERQLLNVMTCQDFEWFAQVLFEHLSCMDNMRRDHLIHYMLTSDLMKKDWLVELFKTRSCIHTVGGSLKKPSDLIDPDSRHLQCLYDDGDDRFPSGVYGDLVARQALIRLGMQSDKISLEDIIERAKSVLPLSRADQEKAVQRTSHLLVYLENAQLSALERIYLSHELPAIQFLPVCRRPPQEPLRWWVDNQDCWLYAGQNIWPESCKSLISSQVAVLNMDKLGVKSSSNTLDLCGVPLDKPVPMQLLHGQLEKLIACRSTLTKPSKQLLEFFEATSRRVYEYLEDLMEQCVSDEVMRMAETVGSRLCDFLREQPWIWYDRDFLPARVFSFDWDGGDHLPYFCRMPDRMSRKFRRLLHTARVKQSFLVDDYLSAMQEIYEKKQGPGQVASKKEISFLLHLANLINEGRDTLDDAVELCGRVVLVSKQLQLLYVKDLTYDDVPWVSDKSPIKARFNYLHERFPRQVAEDLGMKTLRMLHYGGLPDNQPSLAGDLFGEEFGQKEQLCDRLEQILRNYPADVTIFKELIQNADDCGATEIHFILDRTKYKGQSLYNESDCWAGLQQRPALCVFNNRPFTENDIKGISRLGRGGKRDDPSSVGRFGIGFNAVYHLTDCPMFVSRGANGIPENMCLLDPRRKYWPFATELSPGWHWHLTQEKENLFSDQFAPFLKNSLRAVTDTDTGSTVFRLPLREKKDIHMPCDEKTHPISTEEWGPERVLDLFMELNSEARTLLLYLNNLQKITASVKDKGGVHELFSATSSLTDDAVKERQKFALAVKRYSCDTPQVVRVNYYLAVTQVTENTAETKRWQELAQKNFASDKSNQPPSASVLSHKTMQHTRRGVKSLVHTLDCKIGTVHESWLILQSLGVEPATVTKEIQETLEFGWDYTLLPRGGIAVPLAGARLGYKGRAYTFLPLPITTGFPVHVNADFVLDDGRRFISRSSRSHDIDNVWNHFVLSEIVPELYTQALCLATGEMVRRWEDRTQREKQKVDDPLKKHLDWFYSLFPRHHRCNSPQWEQVASFVYQKLADQHAIILCHQKKVIEPDAGQAAVEDDSELKVTWLPVTGDHQGIFHDLVVSSEKNEAQLINLLLTCGMKLTSAPHFLKREFSKCERADDVSTLSPELARTFFRNMANHCGMNKLPFVTDCGPHVLVTITLLLNYCLSNGFVTAQKASPLPASPSTGPSEAESDEVDEYAVDTCLAGLPFLVTADGCLRRFGERSPVFPPEFCRLLPHLLCDFVNVDLWQSTPLREIVSSDLTLLPDRKSKIVVRLSVQHVASNVSAMDLPMDARLGRAVGWDKERPSTDWLRLLWDFLRKHDWTEVSSACNCANFSVIPTTTGRLMALCQTRVIAQLSCLVSCQDIAETMIAMGCPFLHLTPLMKSEGSTASSALDPDLLLLISPYLNKHLADINNPTAAMQCLLAVAQLDTNIEPGRLDQLLIHLLSPPAKRIDKSSIKRLPLYPTTDGRRVPLRGTRAYFWPSSMPGCGLDPDKLFEKVDLTLLNPQGHVAIMIKNKLDVKDIDVAELYSKYLYEQLQEMSHKDVCQHLKFIRNEIFWYYDLNVCFRQHPWAQELLSQLKTLPFVTVQQCPDCVAGASTDHKDRCHIHLPSELFDPDHAVFAVRHNATQFPHQEKWLGDDWKPFLLHLGLQNCLPRRLFLQYAKDVSLHALPGLRTRLTIEHRDSDVNWKELSQCLLSNFFSEQLRALQQESGEDENWLESSTTRKFLHSVQDIPFLFRQDQLKCVAAIRKLLPEEDLPRLTAVLRDHTLVPFRGTALAGDAALVWTSLPVLPPARFLVGLRHSGNIKDIFTMLGIISPPDTVAVARHWANLCHSLACQATLLQSDSDDVKNAKEQLYRQLDKVYTVLNASDSDGINDEVTDLLKGVPCIIVNHEQPGHIQLVLASQLCRSIEEEIQPAYLLQVPSQYQCYDRLLKSLGTTDRPTAGQYAGVLRMLYTEYGETPLRKTNNGANAAVQAVGGLVRCLRADHKGNPPKEGEEYPTAEHLQPLYLPSEDLVLLPSDRLVYPDSPHLYDQLVHTGMFKFVISLTQCGDHGEPNGLTLPPRGMGLHLLSQLVTKELRSGTLNSTNLAVIAPHSKLAHDLDSLRVILGSAEFTTAVRRLHFHQHKCQHGDHEEALLQQLQNCEMACVKRLLTVSVHSRTGQVIDGTDSEATCYIQRSSSCSVDDTDYSNGSEDDEDLCCEPAVVCIQAQDAVNDYLSFLSSFAREIGVYLRSTGDKLPLFQVLRTKTPKDIPGILHRYGIPQFHDRRCQPCDTICLKYGTELTSEEQLLLVDDPTLPLSSGDCVAYKEEEDTAPVTALVLGKVEDEQWDSGPQFVTKWKLKIGDSSGNSEEVILASQLQLYKFRKNIMLRSELGLAGCDVESAIARQGNQQLGSETGEHQDISELVQQAAKLPTEECKRLLCRLWKTYHPARQPPEAHLDYSVCFGHLLQCVQNILDGQMANSFSEVVEGRLVPKLQEEAKVVHEVLSSIKSGRKVRRNGLFSRPEPAEVCAPLRRQYGVIIHHLVSYLPTQTLPGPWMGGHWRFVHSNTCGQQQCCHFQQPSAADQMTGCIIQHLTNLRQYFTRQLSNGSKIQSSYQAWSESYATVELLLKLFLHFCTQREESMEISGSLVELLGRVTPFLPDNGEDHALLQSISTLQGDENHAQLAWKAAKSVLGCLLTVMKRLSDDTEEHARIVQALTVMERNGMAGSGGEQEDTLPNNQA